MNRDRLLNRLRGCYVTVPTQFHDADLELNLPAIRRHVEFLLPDGNLLTSFGTGYRSQSNAQGMSSPRDVGIVQWRLSKKPPGKSSRFRDAAPDSDLRNWLDPRTGQPAPPAQ